MVQVGVGVENRGGVAGGVSIGCEGRRKRRRVGGAEEERTYHLN